MLKLRSLVVGLGITLALSTSALGCAESASDDTTDEDALYQVPTGPAPGESRDIALKDFPALSRDAAQRARGEADAIIATWHVHSVRTADGVDSTLIYGADAQRMVRLAIVLDDTQAFSVPTEQGATRAQLMFVIEPDAEATIEPPLSELKSQPALALGEAQRQWFHDEFARMAKEIAAQAEASAAGLQTQAFTFSAKCAARLTTTALSFASAAVLGPVGAMVVSTLESAAWGDFEGATIGAVTSAGLAGASAGTKAMEQSQRAAVARAGAVLRTLGKVATSKTTVGVALVGAGLLLAGSEKARDVLAEAVPAQCRTSP